MDRLPVELRDHICNFISFVDLKALALTERRWAAAATPQLRSVVHVEPWPGSLNQLLQRLTSIDAQSRARTRVVNLHLPEFPPHGVARRVAPRVLEQFETFDQLRESVGVQFYQLTLQKIAEEDSNSARETVSNILTHALDIERAELDRGMEELHDFSKWDRILRLLPNVKTLLVDAKNTCSRVAPCWSIVEDNMHLPGSAMHGEAPNLVTSLLTTVFSSPFRELEVIDAEPDNCTPIYIQPISGLTRLSITSHASTYQNFNRVEPFAMDIVLGNLLDCMESFSLKWIHRDGPHLVCYPILDTYGTVRPRHLSLSTVKLQLVHFKPFLKAMSSTLQTLELEDMMFFRREGLHFAKRFRKAFGLFRFIVEHLRLKRARFTGIMTLEGPYDMACLVPKTPFTPAAYDEVTMGSELARAVAIGAEHWCGPGQPPDLQQRVHWIASTFGILGPAKSSKPDLGDSALEGMGALLNFDFEDQ